MSTAQEGSSGVSRRCKKTDKGRRIWTTKEEEVLMAAMKEMIVHGWKSDNGFRAGYLTRLEDPMKKAFPNTDLKGSPNINSKLATWKKNYYSLTSILNRSGIGWNLNGVYMIECTNDQWDQICKVDNNARTMRYKPWPFYDDWSDIFGKDRANGENAEDIGDAFYNVMREEPIPDDANGGSYHVHMDEVFPNEIPDESFSQSGKVTASPKKAGKKRKERDDNTKLCDVLAEIGRSTNARLDHLATRIGYEYDLGQARKEAFQLLGSIPWLDLDQRLDICAHIIEKVERLEMFIGLPDDARARFVMRLLAKL